MSRVKNSRASPTTFIGEEPSGWWADWELVVALAQNRRMCREADKVARRAAVNNYAGVMVIVECINVR